MCLAALAISWGAGSAVAQRTPHPAPVAPAAQMQNLPAPAAAPTTNVDVTPTGGDIFGPALNRMSVVSLFLRADAIVKAVFVLLVLASPL